METYLKHAQTEEIKAEQASLAKTVESPYAQDKAGMNRRLRDLQGIIDTQSAPEPNADDRDRLSRRNSELEPFIQDGMPTDQEMRRCPPGAIGRNLRWENGEAARVGLRTRKEAILEWKNNRRQLNIGNDDPDLANVETLRRRDGGQLNLDNSLVPGGAIHSVPSEQAMANYDQIFGDSLEDQIARNISQGQFLLKQMEMRKTDGVDVGPEDIDSAIADNDSELQNLIGEAALEEQMGPEHTPEPIPSKVVKEYETAPCGKEHKKGYFYMHKRHCPEAVCKEAGTA